MDFDRISDFKADAAERGGRGGEGQGFSGGGEKDAHATAFDGHDQAEAEFGAGFTDPPLSGNK